MIKHHPSDDILAQFAAGQLPVSVSVAVSIHVEMCTCCQEQVAKYTERAANESLVVSDDEGLLNSELDEMFEQITQDQSIDSIPVQNTQMLKWSDKEIIMPSALRQLELSDWSGLGKVSRSRVKLDDKDNRSSLLHIDAGGQVPAHTHTGQELTVLLEGSFKDEMGEYHRGDFIWLTGEHKHQPISEKGCLCYAVVTNPLHFTEGLSRLLNPIGKLIY